jgi:hypothetical protein
MTERKFLFSTEVGNLMVCTGIKELLIKRRVSLRSPISLTSRDGSSFKTGNLKKDPSLS